jgi:hypothetical protein
VHFGNSMQEKPAFYLCGGKLLFKNWPRSCYAAGAKTRTDAR